jgi:hypothetical protein
MDGASAIITAFALLAALAAMAWRRGQRTSDSANSVRSKTAQAQITWAGTYSHAFQRTLDLLQALDCDITMADPNRGSVTARLRQSPASAAPLGGTFSAVITTRQGITLVDIEVVPAIHVLGRRGAEAFVADFLDAWDRLPLPISTASQ